LASIENSSILNLQSQTDQLQNIVSHIDVELGRLKNLVKDIADGKSQLNTSK